MTVLGMIWGWIGTPVWIPIRHRWVWSSPYSYQFLSTILGGSTGFLVGVLLCVLWKPDKLGVHGKVRQSIGLSCLGLCVVSLMTQFHMAEQQYVTQYRLYAAFQDGIAPIFQAWRQTQPNSSRESEQMIAVRLISAQTALHCMSQQLLDEHIDTVQPLSLYLGQIGYDMLNHKMSYTEQTDFQKFLDSAGPFIKDNVNYGIELTPQNLRKVFDTLYADIPAEYRNP
jgi:hypothetical protein